MSTVAARPTRSLLPYIALVLGAVATTVAALVLSNGHPVAAFAPTLIIAALWGVTRIPLRIPVLVLLFLVLSLDYVSERSHHGLWDSPLFPLGELLFSNFSAVTGIEALRFPLLDAIILFLLGLGIYRRATGSTLDRPSPPLPLPLTAAVALSAVTIVAMEGVGILRGGADVRGSLWQWHQLGFLPMLVMLYHFALRGPRDHVAVAKVVVAAAFVKACIGTYFILFIARPNGWEPEYATCHSDSMTYVASVLIAVVPWLERPTRRAFLRALLIVAVVGVGLYFNDRRIAYVSLTMALITAVWMSPWTPMKRFLTRAFILLLPLIVAYVAAGWRSSARVFSPVQTLRSLVETDKGNGELDYRELENLNLRATWRRNPFLGTGYGHGFDEPFALPDIARVFPQYRLHPHNSLLGLFAFGGVFGAAGLLAYLVVTVFLAARVYHRAHDPAHRAAALVAVGMVGAYLNQCFGDMATISWLSTFHVAVTVVCVGKLATELNIWPRYMRAGALARRNAPAAPPSGAHAP